MTVLARWLRTDSSSTWHDAWPIDKPDHPYVRAQMIRDQPKLSVQDIFGNEVGVCEMRSHSLPSRQVLDLPRHGKTLHRCSADRVAMPKNYEDDLAHVAKLSSVANGKIVVDGQRDGAAGEAQTRCTVSMKACEAKTAGMVINIKVIKQSKD